MSDKRTKNILLVGVGGQGTILAAHFLCCLYPCFTKEKRNIVKRMDEQVEQGITLWV